MVDGKQRHIVFVDMPDIEGIFGESQARYRSSRVIYAKLVLFKILPQTVDRVLYLDSDTLILKSLSHVYSIDMNGMCITGVTHTSKTNLFKKVGLPTGDYVPDSFVNGGFYLQNLQMMRDPDVEKRIIEAIRSRKDKHVFYDEAIVEYVFRGNIPRLSPIYNSFESFTCGLYKKGIYNNVKKHVKNIVPFEEWRAAFYHPAIIHFPGSEFFRPYISGLCPHPYKKRYRMYMSASPWRDDALLPKHEPEWKRALVFLLYKAFPYLAYLARLRKYYYQRPKEP